MYVPVWFHEGRTNTRAEPVCPLDNYLDHLPVLEFDWIQESKEVSTIPLSDFHPFFILGKKSALNLFGFSHIFQASPKFEELSSAPSLDFGLIVISAELKWSVCFLTRVLLIS